MIALPIEQMCYFGIKTDFKFSADKKDTKEQKKKVQKIKKIEKTITKQEVTGKKEN